MPLCHYKLNATKVKPKSNTPNFDEIESETAKDRHISPLSTFDEFEFNFLLENHRQPGGNLKIARSGPPATVRKQ